MKIQSLTEKVQEQRPLTMLIYCQPGVGKSTSLGIIAEQSEGRTLILDVDRTFTTTMSKDEIVHDLSKVDIIQIDNIHTFEDWTNTLRELNDMSKAGTLNWENICVDNISELERCILSDLGSQGKNKGVPAQSDYQYMQFKLVNSLRFMKSWNKNIFWTAWETTEHVTNLDGTQYSQKQPKISAKIVDNICGLCDVVARVTVNRERQRGFILETTGNIYAKNQRDSRRACKVEEFLKGAEQ